MKAVKKVLLSLVFPVLMFVVMLVITMNSDKCIVNGRNIFLGKDLVKQVVINMLYDSLCGACHLAAAEKWTL